VLLLAVTLAAAPPPDSVVFASAATERLVRRGIARRTVQDTAVHDYRATLRYQLWYGFSARKWAAVAPAAIEEQVMAMAWQRPNDLRVEVRGRRTSARGGAPGVSSVFDRPWFVPREVDDSVRIFADEFPAHGALHPLAASGPEWYRYEVVDSLAATLPDGREVRVVAVDVLPRRAAPALVVGRLWLDAATSEVVRFTFRYVGTGLFAVPDAPTAKDSAAARRANRVANRIVTIDVDLEYAVQAGGLWMPHRQTLSGQVQVPFVGNLVIPFEATTRFDDYEINTGVPIAFRLAPDSATAEVRRERRQEIRDSMRAERRRGGTIGDGDVGWDFAGYAQGGRYEILRPGNDSLARYDGWGGPLALAGDAAAEASVREARASLAALAERVPDDLNPRPTFGFALERTSDLVQYNRVQGLSLGAGARLRLPLAFTDLYGSARFGFSDERLTGRLSVVREAPGGRLRVSGYRDILDADAFSPGKGFANSLNALFVAHDNGSYFLGTGGSVGFETSVGRGIELALEGRLEQQDSVVTTARSGVNDALGGDGLFPPNVAITPGLFGVARVGLAGASALGWGVAVDGIAGEGTANARLIASGRYEFNEGGPGFTIRARIGGAVRDTLPQFALTAGGVNTVRGFDYAAQRGQAAWSAQLDVTPLKSWFRPVGFIDAGRAGRWADLADGRTLVGAGAGLSIYSKLLRTSLVRFDFSYPLTQRAPDQGWRFDLIVSAVR